MRNDVNEWKKEYESVPVPPELETDVRNLVTKGVSGKGTGKVVRVAHRYGWIKGVVAAVLAIMIVFVAALNVSPAAAHAMQNIPGIGAVAKVFTFRTYEDVGEDHSAYVEVPYVEIESVATADDVDAAAADDVVTDDADVADAVEEEGQIADALNLAIEDYTNLVIAQYEADVAAAYAADGYESESANYDLDLTYDVVTDNDSLFALRFDLVLLMTSGNESIKIYNVDKATGEILTLGDLFTEGSDYIDVLTKNIQDQMVAQMAEDENLTYWIDSGVDAWDFKELSEDATFYVNEDGEIVIVFNKGEIAPNYMGVCEFTIPADVVADIANARYLG